MLAKEHPMKLLLTLAPVFVLCLAGCDKDKPPSKDSKPSAEDVKRKGREAAEAAGEFTREKKEQFQAEMKEGLSKMQDQLKDLKARAEKGGEETRKKLQPQIDELERKTETARKKLEELKDKSVEAWKKAKPDLENAMQDLKSAFKKAADHFKKD
jgi:hypothetical protein